jgi:pimeloyl-ACP methyl ester carboxylesterase
MTPSPEWFVPVEGAELCVQSFGDPAQPTLVLVSGAAASMDSWDPDLCARLGAGGRHVVRYDHRDTGRSTTGKPGAPEYDASQLDGDCVTLIERLDVGPVHLAGLSMGGGIAQVIALRRPDLVTSLTLMATSPIGGETGELPGPTAEVVRYFESPPADPDWSGPSSYADWVLHGEAAFAGSIPVDEARLRALAGTVLSRSNDVAAAGNHWLVVDSDSDGAEEPLDVHRITVPTMVIHGSADPLFPLPHGEALAEAIPGARLVVVPGMGHQVPPPATWDVVVPALLQHTRSTPS